MSASRRATRRSRSSPPAPVRGGGAAGVAGSFGVVLLHDSAEAFIADGAQVNKAAYRRQGDDVENVFNVGITGSGAGAADVSASRGQRRVVGCRGLPSAMPMNKDASYQTANQSVGVVADSSSNLVTVAAQGGGAGAASVGGVFDANVLTKRTKAYIGEGADVAARHTIEVAAASHETSFRRRLDPRRGRCGGERRCGSQRRRQHD